MRDKKIQEITKQLEDGVKDVFENGKYKKYLDFMNKFYNYSVNNIILIMMQKPEASLVAGYKAWKTKFNRQVRKGEKGITIFAPCVHKKTVNRYGVEEEITWTSFRAIKVFDISQTDGTEIPTIVTQLEDDVQNFSKLKNKLISISPVHIDFCDIKQANGYYDVANRKIVVKSNMGEAQTIKTIIHEISHAILHNKEDGSEKDADANTREVQAESIAYSVCQMLGIDTSEYSFGYVASWSKDKTIKELNRSMEVIRKTSKNLIDQIQIA